MAVHTQIQTAGTAYLPALAKHFFRDYFHLSGINTDPKYTETVIRKLSEVTGFEVKAAPNMIDASSDMGDFMIFSGMLRRLAVKLSKIANDLRLLSSGPRGGLNDLNLPAVQPGSSM
jgi:aspartate ammonia-lyase